MNIGDYAVPLFILAVVLFALLKGTNGYSAFVAGAGDGIHTAIKLLPSLTALIMAVEFFNASGLSASLAAILSPITESFGLPAETVPLMLMRPISGSGSTAVMTDIFLRYGTDSKIGLIASVLCASTETTFYSISVYYGSCGVKKIGSTLFAALAADFTACVVSILTVNLIFF